MNELIQQTEELILHAFEIGRTRGFAEGYDAGYKRGIDALTDRLLQKSEKEAS